jgi:hypothetical protein
MKTDNAKDKRCRWCDTKIGQAIFDGTVFRVGNCLLYHRTKLFCGHCERSYVWIPANAYDVENEPEKIKATDLIRRELAAIKKHY